jgi:hypothetical protein
MPKYQVCSVDSGGLTLKYDHLDCATDLAAVAVAETLVEAGGVAEVWAGSRRVEIVSVPKPMRQRVSNSTVIRRKETTSTTAILRGPVS